MKYVKGNFIFSILILYMLENIKQRYNSSCIMMKFLLGYFIFSLTILSLSPHQEPRFLLPLLFPLILLIGDQIYKKFWVTQI